jgi:hypothetical protein
LIVATGPRLTISATTQDCRKGHAAHTYCKDQHAPALRHSGLPHTSNRWRPIRDTLWLRKRVRDRFSAHTVARAARTVNRNRQRIIKSFSMFEGGTCRSWLRARRVCDAAVPELSHRFRGWIRVRRKAPRWAVVASVARAQSPPDEAISRRP